MTDDIRLILYKLAHQLRRGAVSPDLARFSAYVIESFLEGRHKTMDEAFGMKPRRNPGREKAGRKSKNFDLACDALTMQMFGASWEAVCDKWGGGDADNLRKICKRHRAAVVQWHAEQIMMRLRGHESRPNVDLDELLNKTLKNWPRSPRR
jgi:hypothetical protein